jgi:hypothetical protein
VELEGTFEFRLKGVIDSVPISPNHIDMAILKEFTVDVVEFLNAEQSKEKQKIIVSIEDRSLGIVPHILIGMSMALSGKIAHINESKDLTVLTEKQAMIIEKWQEKAKKNNSIELIIGQKNTTNQLRVNRDSKYKWVTSDIWVETEVYLYGTITDVGGATKPNIHLKDANGVGYMIDCKIDDVLEDTTNRVYRYYGVRATGKQNINSKELKDLKFVDYIDYNPTFKKEKLQEFIDSSSSYWEGVKDSVEWVRNLRGGYE